MFRFYIIIFIFSVCLSGLNCSAEGSGEEGSIRVVVAGQVMNPGQHRVVAKASIVEAIITAGGCTQRAGRLVQIRRAGNKFGSYKIQYDPKEEIIVYHPLEKSPKITYLKEGDIVILREGGGILQDDWNSWTRDQAELRR